MEGIIAVVMIFGMPVFIVGIREYFKAVREGKLGPGVKASLKELDELRQERNRLEARVQNLESIVCSVDLELNTRMNRLLASQETPRLPPANAATLDHDGASRASLPSGGTLAEPAAAAIHANTLAVTPFKLATSSLAPGQKIAGRYVIERELGRGAMGTVYLALDEKLSERVALKIVSPLISGDPEAAAERFRREVSAARKVTHANVIRIHDLIEHDGLLLLSMEYVDGMTLATLLGRRGPLPLDEARRLLGQLCDGLAAAHAAGVIHRDLKPSNVLLDAALRVKVIDFGLARASFMAGMTATGLILGTPEYMAPEQVRGLPCDARTDLYALGALAYHVLCGRPPFSGETPIAIGFAHVTEPPRSPLLLRPDLPPSVAAALLRALEKDPARRFTAVSELKQALLG